MQDTQMTQLTERTTDHEDPGRQADGFCPHCHLLIEKRVGDGWPQAADTLSPLPPACGSRPGPVPSRPRSPAHAAAPPACSRTTPSARSTARTCPTTPSAGPFARWPIRWAPVPSACSWSTTSSRRSTTRTFPASTRSSPHSAAGSGRAGPRRAARPARRRRRASEPCARLTSPSRRVDATRSRAPGSHPHRAGPVESRADGSLVHPRAVRVARAGGAVHRLLGRSDGGAGRLSQPRRAAVHVRPSCSPISCSAWRFPRW